MSNSREKLPEVSVVTRVSGSTVSTGPTAQGRSTDGTIAKLSRQGAARVESMPGFA